MAAPAPREPGHLGDIGNHGDPVGALEQPLGYGFVAPAAEFFENLDGGQQASLLTRLGMHAVSGTGENHRGEQGENRSAGAH